MRYAAECSTDATLGKCGIKHQQHHKLTSCKWLFLTYHWRFQQHTRWLWFEFRHHKIPYKIERLKYDNKCHRNKSKTKTILMVWLALVWRFCIPNTLSVNQKENCPRCQQERLLTQSKRAGRLSMDLFSKEYQPTREQAVQEIASRLCTHGQGTLYLLFSIGWYCQWQIVTFSEN